MKKIFISHPYSDDPLGNLDKVEEITSTYPENELLLSPLHLFSMYQDCEETAELRQEILEICYALIDLADEVHFYGCSEGCQNEFWYAKKNRKVMQFFGDGYNMVI